MKKKKTHSSKKSGKLGWDEKSRKISYNGKEWKIFKKESKQFYLLRILLCHPHKLFTMEEIKSRFYSNDEKAKKILSPDSGRETKDLVNRINKNAQSELNIEQLLSFNGHTIELLVDVDL